MARHGRQLAAGTRVVHIGPHKTGTTALQGAFHLQREKLADRGVVYVGNDRQPMRAALAVTNRPAMLGEPAPAMSFWANAVEQATQAGDDYVVLSSEFLADGDEDAAQRVVTDLGPRTHVVVTVRPLAKIMPSQWQQYVQNGMRTRFHVWLKNMLLDAPYEQPTPTFWQRHRHDRLVERWAKAVGPENLTVVVVDDSDRRMLLDTFETFLGLPEGFLELETDNPNRSLTLGEAEIVRLLNVEFRREDWPGDWYARYVRYGAVKHMKETHRPLPTEQRIQLPRWAREKVAEVGAEIAANLRGLGVEVIGDLDSLTRVSGPSTGPTAEAKPHAESPRDNGASRPDDLEPGQAPPPPTLSAAAAAQAVIGTIIAAEPPPPEEPARKTAPRPEDLPVKDVEAAALVRILLRRGRRRLGRVKRRLIS